MDEGFKRGSGLSMDETALGFELLLYMVMFIVAISVIYQVFAAWSKGEVKTNELISYSLRALVLLIVTIVLFGVKF